MWHLAPLLVDLLIFAGAAALAPTIMGCESKKKSEPPCDYDPPEQKGKAETLAEMKAYQDKFGYDHKVYRFNPLTTGDLNKNKIDDWLVVRTVKGGQSYCSDTSVVLDMPEEELKAANLDELVVRYFKEVPDRPSRTIHWHYQKDGKTQPVSSDPNHDLGPLLLGPVVMIQKESPEARAELNLPVNKVQGLKFFVTPEGWPTCASQVASLTLTSTAALSVPDLLKVSNAQRSHVVIPPLP